MAIDEQRAKLQGLWRKAYRDGKPIEVPCRTASSATKLRFAMYDAVRAFRRGTAQADEELAQAIENCMLSFKEGDRTVLVVTKKTATELMSTIDGILGDDQTLAIGQEDVEARAMAERLQRKVESGEGIETMPTIGVRNAYNTRD
jgi:hypothetical protein